MKIEVRPSNLPFSEPLAEHLRKKLEFALRRFVHRVDLVVVRLNDMNGPRGGCDKRCRISARLFESQGQMFVQAIDADAYVAVSEAASRLEDRVQRAIERGRFSPLELRRGLRRSLKRVRRARLLAERME